jgi:hypothetical protein
MDNTLTLREFVLIAKFFLYLEIERLQPILPGHNKELNAALDRIEDIERWLEQKRVFYINSITAEFQLLDDRISRRDSNSETAQALKSIQSPRLKFAFEAAHGIVEDTFARLQEMALRIKNEAYHKF